MKDNKALMHLFFRFHRLVFHRAAPKLSQAHPGQMPLLKCLAEDGNCSQAYLSKHLDVSPAAVAVSLKRLEKQGLIARKTNPVNQRENIIALTDEGTHLHTQMECSFDTLNEMAFECLTDEEFSALHHIMGKICDHLTESINKEK